MLQRRLLHTTRGNFLPNIDRILTIWTSGLWFPSSLSPGTDHTHTPASHYTHTISTTHSHQLLEKSWFVSAVTTFSVFLLHCLPVLDLRLFIVSWLLSAFPGPRFVCLDCDCLPPACTFFLFSGLCLYGLDLSLSYVSMSIIKLHMDPNPSDSSQQLYYSHKCITKSLY